MASGDQLAKFLALNNEPPASSAARISTLNGVMCLAFGPTADSIAEFGDVFSRAYGGGGLTITVGWTGATGAASGSEVKWEIAIERVPDDTQPLNTLAYTAVQGVLATHASADFELDYATITFTDGAQMDSLAVGEYYRLRILRDVSDETSDPYGGDALLAFLEVRET